MMTAAPLGIRTNLEVHDVPRSIEFYRRALGLEPVATIDDPPVFAILAAGDATLAIAQAEHPAVAGIAGCYVDVADVDAAHEHCAAAGIDVTEPVSHPWQMRDFVLRDPDGHQIAVGQRLGS